MLEAREEAVKQAADRAVSLAWHSGLFSGLAFNGKLKKLAHYLGDAERPAGAHSTELMAMFRRMKKQGKAVKIKRLA